MTTTARRVPVQELVIEAFPRPEIARALSPNGRAHWATRHHWTQVAQVIPAMIAKDQGLQPMHGFVVLTPTFVYPNVRKRDDDNLATGVLKAVRDGLVKAGFLEADDLEHLRQLPVEVRVEKGRRALILKFEMPDLGRDGGEGSAG